MTTTILRTIGGVDDVRAALTNSTLRRLLSIGSTWSRLRIGIRWCANGSATISGTPKFAMGVCSGTSNPHNNGSATTTHFLGGQTNKSTWDLSEGLYFLNTGTVDFQGCKRVGTTTTLGNNISSLLVPTVGLNKAWMFFLDITKGSPTFQLRSFRANLTSVPHITKEEFLATVEVDSAAYTGHVWSTNISMTVDEALNGYLDAVNLSWDRTSPTIEVSDIAIVRLA